MQAGGAVLTGRSVSTPAELLRRYGPAAAGYALPFLLVFYLALRGGGYDSIVRGEVGIAVWWVVLLGAAVGALPATRLSRSAWIMLGLLAAFGAWTALSISWSESSERSAAELARVAAYLGVFTLAVAAQGRDGLRRAVYSIGAAIAVVGIFALLSRLHPSWFPRNEGISALGDTARTRLNYPLNYWNGLAALVAIGIPLLLVDRHRGSSYAHSRPRSGRGPGALRNGLLHAVSRRGARARSCPRGADRTAPAASRPVAHGGGRGWWWSARGSGGEPTSTRLPTDSPISSPPRRRMRCSRWCSSICAGVGLLQAAVSLAARYELGPRLRISRRNAGIAAAIAAIAAVSIALAAGLPGEISDRWDEFKDPVDASTAQQFEDRTAVRERQRQWPLPVLAVGARRQRNRRAERDRGRNLRVLVGSRWDDSGVHSRRPLALPRDPRRTRHRRIRARRRPDRVRACNSGNTGASLRGPRERALLAAAAAGMLRVRHGGRDRLGLGAHGAADRLPDARRWHRRETRR